MEGTEHRNNQSARPTNAVHFISPLQAYTQFTGTKLPCSNQLPSMVKRPWVPKVINPVGLKSDNSTIACIEVCDIKDDRIGLNKFDRIGKATVFYGRKDPSRKPPTCRT
jgi:hypothetical protein